MKSHLKNIFIYLMVSGTLILLIPPAYSQYTGIYQHFFEKAQESIRKKDYRSALLYLETAQTVQPESPEVLKYLNIVKHAIQDRIRDVQPSVVRMPEPEPASQEAVKSRKKIQPLSSVEKKMLSSDDGVSSSEIQRLIPQPIQPSRQSATPRTDIAKTQSETPLSSWNEADRERIIFDLNDDAWSVQPDMEIEVALNEEILMRGGPIDRYLVVSPDVVDVIREGNREIVIVPKRYGQTFLHIWENQKRWTFYIKTVFPTQKISQLERLGTLRETYEKSFRLFYDVNWNTFYQGPSKRELDHQSYQVRNQLRLRGPSPYGDWDSYAVFYDTNTDHVDLTDYSIGLTDAKWKDIKDIHIRIFDASRYLSDLTMPGRDFRGILLSGTSVDDRFAVTALRGRDRASFGLLSSRYDNTRDSYIEAGKLSYRLNEQKRVSANYAHAWGSDKPETSRSHVYSLDFEHTDEDWNLYSEAAYDEERFAQIIWSRHQFQEGNFFIKVRNIPSQYATVVGPTGNQGEVGAEFSLSHQVGRTDVSHYLDLYRDRDNKNPNDEDAINADFHSNFSIRLTDRNSASGSMYVIHTPGTLADQTDFRISGTFNRRLDVFQFSNALLSWTGSYQRSRSGASPFADYDRMGLVTNFYLPLNRFFNYNASYEIYCVDDVFSNEMNYPRAFNTGLFYHQTFFEKLRVNSQIYYRDEEKTEDEKSFMSGQDYITLSSGVDYTVRPGMSIYLDGRLRDIWSENNRTSSYAEADVRLGMHSEWDLGFSWNPRGVVQGHVFRDLNNDGKKDENEPGIPGVRVKVGDGQAITDQEGWYYKEVGVTRVQVSLDINTMPQGYIFTDTADKIFKIEHNHFYDGSFALTTQSGIYGVVYHDKNHNGRPDNGDEFLYRVKLILNGSQYSETDAKGTYFFYNLPEGLHTLSLDMNSLPEQYLPKIPLTNDISVAEGAMYIFHIPVTEK